MDGLSEFLNMGGYAPFVWPSFGATVAIMAVLLVVSLRTLKRNQAALDALKDRENGADEA